MVKKGELLSVFSIGAAGYSLLEILWRGNTHWTMTLAGGICFMGNPFGQYLRQSLIGLEKMFSGIRADYNC